MTTITTEVGTVDQSVTGYTTTPVRGTASFNSDVQTRMNEMGDNATEINTLRTQVNTVSGNINSVASEMNTVASEVNQNAIDAEGSATSAESDAAIAASYADAIIATSTTSTTIGTGSKAFTVQTGKQFAAGQFVSIISDANPGNYMHGAVTSYSGTTLVVSVSNVGGSGTFSDWGVSLSGSQGPRGESGESGYRQLLYTVTASGATEVVFEGGIDATYDKYLIESHDMTGSSSSAYDLLVGTGTGPTYSEVASYRYLSRQHLHSTSTPVYNRGVGLTYYYIGEPGGGGYPAAFTLEVFNPTSVNPSPIKATLTDALTENITGGSWFNSTPITAIKLRGRVSQTITGTFRIYGINNGTV